MVMTYDEARKSDERLSLILSHMDKPPATVMDFGAHLGFFSHGLARAGYDVTAVEPPNERVFDADLVAEHRQWVHTPEDLPAGEFDYVLVLSVLHHIPGWQALLDHLLVHTRKAVFVEVPSLLEIHPTWHESRESYAYLRSVSNARIIGSSPECTRRVNRDLWKVEVG